MPKKFRIGLSLVFFLAGWLAAGFTQPSIAIADTMSLTTLHANIDGNWISGRHFPSNTDMYVSIYVSGDNYKAVFSVTTNDDGHFFAEGLQYWPDQLIARGDVIEVVYDDQSVTQTVTMTVQNLNAKVDPDNNRVTGTAFTPDGDPLVGRMIHMIVYEGCGPERDILHVYREIYVDGDGNFEIGGDPDEFKIERGYGLHLHLHDIPDDIEYITSIHPYNCIPRLQVAQDHNWIKGYGFPYTVNVELSINAETDLTTLINSNSWGHFKVTVLEFADHQLLPGDTIRAEYYDEYYDRDEFVFVTLPHIDASVDTQTGTISGTAPGFAGQSISVEIYSFPFEKRLHETTGQVNQDGEFQVEWEGLEPGQDIRLVLTDSDNNEFLYHPDNSPQVFDGGDGTSENPYIITSAEQLDNVRDHLDAHFILTGNIDLGVSPWNEGDGWEPINWFSGVLDGDGYVISNLTINRPDEDFTGLFKGLEYVSEIRNLSLEGMNVSGREWVGGLAGVNDGTIDNCHVTGEVTGMEYTVGGLVGENAEGLVTNSYAAGDVTGYGDVGGLVGANSGGIYSSYATGHVSGIETIGGLVGVSEDRGIISSSYATGDIVGEFFAGGLAGVNVGSTISNCYATGSVTGVAGSEGGGDYIGGLVGVNGVKLLDAGGEESFLGLVENSYAVGVVSGGDYVGGLIGSQGLIYEGVSNEIAGPTDIAEVENSFWDIGINTIGVGFGADAGAAGKTTQEMQTQATFTEGGWDFGAIWAIEENGYPYLLMADYIPNIEIDNVTIQYRTHENEDRDYYFGWVGFSKDGLPLASWEVREIIFRGPDGNKIDPAYGGFWSNKHYVYDCLSGACSMSDLDVESGFYFGFTGDLAEGIYPVEIETIYGQTETVDIYYPGQLSLPVVSRFTMESTYDNESDSLALNWTNPDSHINWQHVDFLRVVLLDEMDRWLLYVDVDPGRESAIIPAEILDDTEAIHGTSGNRWFIQTRANDEAGMNYARGNSEFANYGYHIEWPWFQYRTYEDEALDSYRGVFDVTRDSMPITGQEISDITVRDIGGNEIGIFDESFYPYEFYRYDCRGETCSEYGPESRSGFYFTFADELAAGPYWLEIETGAGLTEKYVYYFGGLELPVINSASMTSGYEEDDLVLKWTNPVGHENWDSVDGLRILFFDEEDQIILFVEMNPGHESLTISSDVIDTAEAIYGTTMAAWRIHTRAYDENWMDYARGYSDNVTLFDVPVTISGTVMLEDTGLAGVNILVSDDADTETDDNGNYTVMVDPNWSGTVAPSLRGYTFLPENMSYTDISDDQKEQDYTAVLQSYVISGRVMADDKGLSGVVLSGLPGNPETDEDGYYSVETDHGWSGTAVPEKAGYDFVPESIDFEEIEGDKEAPDFAATHRADNQPPDKPVLFQPIGNVVVMAGDVTLEAGPYSDPEDDPHIRTRWQVTESGSGGMVYEYQSEYDATVHVVPTLTPGIKYEWRVGYQDSGSGQFSWSDMESFIVGIKEEDQNVPPVQAGFDLADYRMLSVVHWPARPAAVDVFGPMLTGGYDFGDYRIGTYDPHKDGLGGYHEYPDFEVRPGQAYWVLAREGMAPNVTGVAVTLEDTVHIPLAYNPETLDGWNMIGVPNNARYQWGDIHVMARNASGEVVFGPAPISDLAAGNGYLDKRVWVWEDGRYQYSDAYEFTLDPYAGYWVRVREKEAGENVFLSFLPDFQVDVDAQSQMQQSLLIDPDPQKRGSYDALTAKDLPPWPMLESGGSDDSGSGCFIESLAGDKR